MDKKNLSLQKNGSRRLNVMFGDFCYINRQTVGLRYVPLSIGMIAQYAKQQFGDDINVSLYKSAEKFLEQAKQTPPDVVGMSVYMWNKSLSQYVAKRIREMFGDDVIIIIGGPSIDSDKEEPLNINFDIINWKRNKFKDPLQSYKIPEMSISFNIEKDQSLMIESFQKRFANYNDQDYYHKAMEFFRPRSFMLHSLRYR